MFIILKNVWCFVVFLILLILFVLIFFWMFVICFDFGVFVLLKYFFNGVIFVLIYKSVGLFIGINDVEGLIICFLFLKKFN